MRQVLRGQKSASGFFVRIPFLPYALLLFTVLLAYANTYANAFLYDDLGLIARNPYLTSWHALRELLTSQILQGFGTPSPFYRPLQMLLYFLVYQTSGLSTTAYHGLNIALHLVNACLLYGLGVRLGFQRLAAFLAALLWALHPVQTEAVTFMSGTADPLCGVFLLSGIFVLVPGFTIRRVAVACMLCTFALLSKEVAVVFPLLAMGLLFYRNKDRWSAKTYLQTWPFWLITAFYFMLRATVLNFTGFFEFYNKGAVSAGPIWDRFMTFLATLPTYLGLLIEPTGLHMERSFPLYHLNRAELSAPQVLIGLVILVIVVRAITWKPALPATPLAWGLGWAAALHIPQSGVIFPNDALIYEHWLYLPTMGLALGLGEGLARLSLPRFQPLLATFATLMAALFGFMTFQQNKIWQDPLSFYNHIFDCGETSVRAHDMLGNVYSETGRYDLAIEQYRYVVRANDNDASAHYKLGMFIVSFDPTPTLLDEASRHLNRALEINPNYFKADDALALIAAYRGDPKTASDYHDKSAALKKNLGIK